ncbi:unnamed protein product [Amoebophrya sp. A120]|nr:unnamed protein product [Amoebophrya sp. A120]|eukprot:GSA120T00002795001.1
MSSPLASRGHSIIENNSRMLKQHRHKQVTGGSLPFMPQRMSRKQLETLSSNVVRNLETPVSDLYSAFQRPLLKDCAPSTPTSLSPCKSEGASPPRAATQGGTGINGSSPTMEQLLENKTELQDNFIKPSDLRSPGETQEDQVVLFEEDIARLKKSPSCRSPMAWRHRRGGYVHAEFGASANQKQVTWNTFNNGAASSPTGGSPTVGNHIIPQPTLGNVGTTSASSPSLSPPNQAGGTFAAHSNQGSASTSSPARATKAWHLVNASSSSTALSPVCSVPQSRAGGPTLLETSSPTIQKPNHYPGFNPNTFGSPVQLSSGTTTPCSRNKTRNRTNTAVVAQPHLSSPDRLRNACALAASGQTPEKLLRPNGWLPMSVDSPPVERVKLTMPSLETIPVIEDFDAYSDALSSPSPVRDKKEKEQGFSFAANSNSVVTDIKFPDMLAAAAKKKSSNATGTSTGTSTTTVPGPQLTSCAKSPSLSRLVGTTNKSALPAAAVKEDQDTTCSAGAPPIPASGCTADHNPLSIRRENILEAAEHASVSVSPSVRNKHPRNRLQKTMSAAALTSNTLSATSSPPPMPGKTHRRRRGAGTTPGTNTNASSPSSVSPLRHAAGVAAVEHDVIVEESGTTEDHVERNAKIASQIASHRPWTPAAVSAVPGDTKAPDEKAALGKALAMIQQVEKVDKKSSASNSTTCSSVSVSTAKKSKKFSCFSSQKKTSRERSSRKKDVVVCDDVVASTADGDKAQAARIATPGDLHTACLSGDVALVEQLLDDLPVDSTIESDGVTPLLAVLRNPVAAGTLDVVQMLLRARASLDRTCTVPPYDSPLQRAMHLPEQFERLRLLITHMHRAFESGEFGAWLCR